MQSASLINARPRLSSRLDIAAKLLKELSESGAAQGGRRTGSSDMGAFTDRVVVITGARRGLGRDFARYFAEDGANVVLADLKDAEAATEAATAAGARCLAIRTDVTDRASVDALMARTKAEFGRLDILINNAALWREPESYGLLDCPAEVWNATWAVNLTGVLNGYQAAVPLMKEHGWGRIINVSSTASGLGSNAYGLSKNALELMTTGMAREVGKFGITVNSIVPGICAFEGAKSALPQFDEILARIPLGRVGSSRDLYAAMAYLASDAAAYVTGENMVLDGGLSSR
jgi:NAD(P)-dependent dehydrogenase (short-subunit alcohol dehydrogenase family)